MAQVPMHFVLTFIWILISFRRTVETTGEVSREQTIVWGPGLKSSFVVPVRYFFIQAVDASGNNFTDSPGDVFKVQVYSSSGDRVRVWTQVLDRHDGSFLVRFKLFESYKDLVIEILFEGRHVAESPYTLAGHNYHEKCNCPMSSIDKWLKKMECRKSYKQIKQDLSIFKDIDMDKVEAEAVSRFNRRGSHSLCHFTIKDNKVYRKTYGEHVGFKMFMDAILLSITRKVKLPDMEFFTNLGDWPLEKKKVNDNPIPLFSWCGSEDTRDIIMPTYDVTESTLETMGRVSLDLMSVQSETGPKWENKSDIAFWRGRDSRQERLDLVVMSRRHPQIIDAALTNMFFFPKDESKYGELQKHISFFDFFKHKYQISIDGTVAAYRVPYLLAGDSVVLKQDSPYYEHFYKELKPNVHYIPFKRDLSDLMDKIEWAKENEDLAKQIGQNAQQYVRNNLLSRDVFCYHVILFKEYAKRLKTEPKIREGMEEVAQPNDRDAECQCERQTKKKQRKTKEKKDEL